MSGIIRKTVCGTSLPFALISQLKGVMIFLFKACSKKDLFGIAALVVFDSLLFSLVLAPISLLRDNKTVQTGPLKGSTRKHTGNRRDLLGVAV